MTYEVGKEYKTRGGLVATIWDVNYKGGGGCSIAGKIYKDGREDIITWRSDGLFINFKDEHPYDLMPLVKTKEIWVNVYSDQACVWWGKESSDEYAADDRIGLLKITVTGDDFEVEKVTI